MRKNPLQPKGWKIGTVLLLPVGVYVFMVIIPIFFAAYYSLFKWSGGKSMTFLGIQNYLDILRDDTFWLSFRNTAVFTLLMVVGQVGIAFVFTLFFTMKWMKMKTKWFSMVNLPRIRLFRNIWKRMDMKSPVANLSVFRTM